MRLLCWIVIAGTALALLTGAGAASINGQGLAPIPPLAPIPTLAPIQPLQLPGSSAPPATATPSSTGEQRN